MHLTGMNANASKDACVSRHIGNGTFRKQCLDISERCEQRGCLGNTVCGLDLQEDIQCFNRSEIDEKNCGTDTFRLQQPCPGDAGVLGFGMGCTFCVGSMLEHGSHED